ncbi:hypothetical protein OXX79_010575, partial [Metschnikowia pulcherrima]
MSYNYNSYKADGRSDNSSRHAIASRQDHHYRELEPRERVRETRGSDNSREWRNGGYDHDYRDRRSMERLPARQANERRPYRYQEGKNSREFRGGDLNPEAPVDPDSRLTKEELIKKYERRLIGLLHVPIIDKFPIIGSQWGIKPKGFEKVTAQRAKLSGLFPLPGSPRPVDVTKLEGLIKDGCTEDGILLASSK